MYAYPFIGSVADFMPGSYMMLRRMNAMEGTMPVLAALVVEIIFIIIVGLFGHRLYRRSNS